MVKKKNKINGFSLIEILISILIISLVVGIVAEVFIKTKEVETRTILAQNLQEGLWPVINNLNYEAARAKRQINDSCGLCNGKKFCFTSNKFYFLNKDNICYVYYLENDANNISRLKLEKNDGSLVEYLTPNNININTFKLNIDSNGLAATILIQGENVNYGNYKRVINLQTSICPKKD